MGEGSAVNGKAAKNDSKKGDDDHVGPSCKLLYIGEGISDAINRGLKYVLFR